MSEQDILPAEAALFFDLILENKVDDLKHLITGEYFEFLQLDLAHTRSDGIDTDSEKLMAVSYKMKIFLGVYDAFWKVGIQKSFERNNDCLGVLMDYSLAHSNEAAMDFVFSVLDLVDIKTGTPDEQMFFEQLDEILSFVPDTVIGEIIKVVHPDLLNGTRAGQYICAQWANRLKIQLDDYGTLSCGKKI